MKKFLQKVWRVIRLIFGVELALAALGGVIVSIQSPSVCRCGISAVAEEKAQSGADQWHTCTRCFCAGRSDPSRCAGGSSPGYAETLLSLMQAQNDARILQESFQLCQQTYNFETFFSRLQLVQRCALTLLQAKQAGCKISRQTVKACESALSAASALRLDFLDRIYTKQVTAAMQLKTPAGRRRRLEALLNELQEHDIDFMSIEDTYNEYLQRVQELMDE